MAKFKLTERKYKLVLFVILVGMAAFAITPLSPVLQTGLTVFLGFLVTVVGMYMTSNVVQKKLVPFQPEVKPPEGE